MKYMFIFWVYFLACHGYIKGQSGKEWLKQFEDDAKKIKDFIDGENKGKPYARLAFITDRFGSRLVGFEGLKNTINAFSYSPTKIFDAHEQKVTVTNWKELYSKATFQSTFRNKSLSIIAYGPSENSKGKLKAKILLVKSFEELKTKSSEAKGKIVVYNQACLDYVTCVKYRNDGAAEAAKYGALASLTRTVSFSSINNLHTGPVTYREKTKKIPAAAITVEDAAFIERILKRDSNAIIDLDISTETEKKKISNNIIIDIPGTDLKEEVILSGTHIDSWHAGEGVANNGAGCNILYESMRVIKSLKLQPRRTLRLALWTAGEQNAKGEKKFFSGQKNEKIKLIMRSEQGFFNITGFNINNGEKINNPMREIFDTYFKDWNLVIDSNQTESENEPKWLKKQKFPRMEFLTDMKRYLEVYNSGGDTLDKLTPEELDRAITLWSTILYILGSADGAQLFN